MNKGITGKEEEGYILRNRGDGRTRDKIRLDRGLNQQSVSPTAI